MPPASDEKDGGAAPRIPFGAGDEEPSKRASPSGPRVLFGEALQPRAAPEGPKVIGDGVVRRRIPYDLSDLAKLDSAASGATLRAAARAIDGINLDDHEFDDVVRFGQSLQHRHGELAEIQLTLINQPLLSEIRRLSADLLEQLIAVDPDRLFAAKQGFLGSLRAVLATFMPNEVFERHLGNIAGVATGLADSAKGLPDLRRSVENLRRQWETLALDLQAHVLAGRFVSNFIAAQSANAIVAAHYSAQREALDARIGSLLGTVSSLAVGTKTLELLEASVAEAYLAAVEAAERDLPAWRTTCSAALAIRARDHRASVDLDGIRRHYSKLLKLLGKNAQ